MGDGMLDSGDFSCRTANSQGESAIRLWDSEGPARRFNMRKGREGAKKMGRPGSEWQQTRVALRGLPENSFRAQVCRGVARRPARNSSVAP
jgi:hypothetical protein